MHECSSDRKKTFSFNMCFPGNIDRKIWTFWSSHFFLRRIVGAFSGAGEFCFTCACDSFWIRTWVAVNAAGWNDMQLDRGGCKPPFFGEEFDTTRNTCAHSTPFWNQVGEMIINELIQRSPSMSLFLFGIHRPSAVQRRYFMSIWSVPWDPQSRIREIRPVPRAQFAAYKP